MLARNFARLHRVTVMLLACALAAPVSAHQGSGSEGDRLFAAARFNQAVKAYTDAVHLHPGDIAIRLALIRTLLRLDNEHWQDAVREGRAAVASAPRNADAHGLLALALMRGGQPDAAYEEADRALALAADSYYGLVAMGRMDLWNEQPLVARKTLKRAVDLHPDWPDAYPYLLDTYGDEDHDEMDKIAHAYVKLDPKGHPHDRLLDGYRNSRQSKQLPLKGAMATSEAPGKALQGADPPETYTFPIERNGDDVILPITINGVKCHLLFDSGAGYSIVVNDDVIARMNMPSVGQSVAHGVSGKELTHIYLADTVVIGPRTFHKVEVDSIQKLGDYDGLIGGANFENYAVTLDFSQNTMTLARGKGAGAPPPAEDAHVMTVPFHTLDGYIFVPIRIADRTQTEWGLLDTGAQGLGVLSLITSRELAKQQNDDSYKELTVNRRLGAGTSDPSFTALAFRFAVDLALNNNGGTPFFMEMDPIYGASMVDDQISREFDFQLSAIVGISYLTNARRITIDYPHHLLTMEFANQN